jgi:acetoin utilization deacetylase AcuC-like enzyme
MVILHDPSSTRYHAPGHPEHPQRVAATAELLRARHPGWRWQQPGPAPEEDLRRAHPLAHLARLERGPDFDADTAFLPGIAAHARLAAGAALEATHLALDAGERAFSLMRPPGHHATRNRAMGFCYLNHIAIAALAARARGVERVAVWDFDAHHGNGTEAILDDQPGILFASVHEEFGYPGTGATSTANCRNWALPPFTPRPAHLAALEESWAAVLAFNPGLVLVSAGFDAFAGDPLTQMTLETKDFRMLGGWIHAAGVPAACILEGGYSVQLPELIDSFLCGWNGSHDVF